MSSEVWESETGEMFMKVQRKPLRNTNILLFFVKEKFPPVYFCVCLIWNSAMSPHGLTYLKALKKREIGDSGTLEFGILDESVRIVRVEATDRWNEMKDLASTHADPMQNDQVWEKKKKLLFNKRQDQKRKLVS